MRTLLLWRPQRSSTAVAVAMSVLLAACAREPASSEKPWRVQHYQVPCVGEGVRLCYLIDRGKGEFEYFYDAIAGFDYRWGFNYEVVVSSTTLQPAMADASTLQHRLVSVKTQQRAPADATFNVPVSFEGQVLIEARQGACSLRGAIAIDTSEHGCDALRAREHVTFRHHPSEPRLVPVIEAQ